MQEVHHNNTNYKHNAGHKHVVGSPRHKHNQPATYSSIPIALEEPKLLAPELFVDFTIVLVVGAILIL